MASGSGPVVKLLSCCHSVSLLKWQIICKLAVEQASPVALAVAVKAKTASGISTNLMRK